MYLEPTQTSKMELFTKIVICIQPLTSFAKHSISGVSQPYEYASDKIKQTSGALSFVSQEIRMAMPVDFFHL